METLREYFTYNNDCDISSIFYILSRKLKIIHENKMVVPVIDANHILCDNGFSFDRMQLPNNIEEDKENNVLSLAKLFLGAYISASTGFYDFSHTNDAWFVENMDDIAKVVSSENYFQGYFNQVLLEKKCTYYCDYIDQIKRTQNSGIENTNQRRKVLRTSAGGITHENSNFNDNLIFDDLANITNKKSAFINHLYYPALFLSLLLVGFVIYTCVKYIKL